MNESKEYLEAYWTGHKVGVKMGKKIGYDISVKIIQNLEHHLHDLEYKGLDDYLESMRDVFLSADTLIFYEKEENKDAN